MTLLRPARLLALCLLSAVACVGPSPARAPTSTLGLPAAFADAFRVDATGEPRAAVEGYLAVVQGAASDDRNPWELAALLASLDALATRSMPALGEAAGDAGLAQRTRESSEIVRVLARLSTDAKGPFARGLIARALGALARRRGDAADAQRQREASGCIREALVVGPLTFAPITGVREADPLERADAKIEGAYPTGDAFATQAHPMRVDGRGCDIPLSVESAGPGVRDVIVDVDVPEGQTVGVVLRAHGAARLRAGGATVLERAFDLGDGEAARFARVAVEAGPLRLVARVGTAKDDDSLEIDVFGATGLPLRAHSPAVGSVGRRSTVHVEPVTTPLPANDDEALLAGAAAMAAGDPRTAERGLWKVATGIDARPDLALVYGRALETARDLSPAARAERARGAYERVFEAWPASWEATIARAVLAGERRGRDEAGLEVLRNLEGDRGRPPGAGACFVDAFEALASGREHMFDRAATALGRARRTLASTSLLADAEDAASPRTGLERVAAACDLARPVGHDTLACFDALQDAGDRGGEAREIARLRDLFGGPSRFLALALRTALTAGDDAGALRAFASMLPAERTMSAAALLSPSQDAAHMRALLLGLAPTAHDSPASLGPLMAALANDTNATFDARADRVAADNRVRSVLPTSATAVLAHDERYEVTAEGMVHFTLFDVRRVSGTTDVEDSAAAPGPDIWGRSAMRTLRRRILKKDGRVIEPDRAPHASQAHADLSQLEQGDIVEAVYEGYALAGDTGDVGIDTPDLLPDRSAVNDATVEIRLPSTLHASLWSHPLLGKATERAEGGTRVLTWHMAGMLERRIEDRVPRMDRSVRVSLSTMVWGNVGRALRETLAALDEHDPEIRDWAHQALGAADPAERSADTTQGAADTMPRAAVATLVAAAGTALREGDSDLLSDYGGGVTAVQDRTARGFLASHQGSRSWLIVRALREIGIASDLVVAEDDPYSADPSFPPHFARFVHPLVVAHLTDGAGRGHAADVWIDADVAGPPLPSGRVSPELRGRLALYSDGSIAPLPAPAETEKDRDEVDVRLALDDAGNARGTFAVVLRGRAAQELAEALYRIVGAERQRALRDVVLSWLPWANVEDVKLASAEGSWQVSLRADVTVSGYAQAQGDKTWLLPGIDTVHWAWPTARVSSLGATFAARADRESALALSTSIQYHLHRRVQLPPGVVVARLPGPIEVVTDLVQASRKIAVVSASTGNAIDEEFTLGVATGTVARADYGPFVSAAHRADDGFLASARLSKGVKPAPGVANP